MPGMLYMSIGNVLVNWYPMHQMSCCLTSMMTIQYTASVQSSMQLHVHELKDCSTELVQSCVYYQECTAWGMPSIRMLPFL